MSLGRLAFDEDIAAGSEDWMIPKKTSRERALVCAV
jgi:hypothetical protein